VGKRTLHLWVSNQSFVTPVIDLRLTTDGEEIWRGELETGQQHNWKSATVQIPSGPVSLNVREERTSAQASRDLDDGSRELWVAVAFDDPQRIAIDIFDHPIALM
jgi:hypothetical protein